ncbi:unnamed protein product, partial [Choristocarpus tenellus]
QGWLLQCVITPGNKWMPKSYDEIAEACLSQVHDLFLSARDLKCTWTNVVKPAGSVHREGLGLDKYRPKHRTPITNFFMVDSYTYQDYIDSMEGVTKSAELCADRIQKDTVKIATAREEE